MNWSKYQEAIFEAVQSSNSSLIVEAVAGSGKTTTLVEIIERIDSRLKVCFVAFNKAIQLQLLSRVKNPNARCMTLHAVGWSAWRTALGWDAGTCRLDGRKMYEILGDQRVASWQEKIKFGTGTVRLVALAKGVGIVPGEVGETGQYQGLVEDTDENWEVLMDMHNLDPTACSIGLARRMLKESIYRSREVCDYDDQLYMPIVSGVPFEQYDVVMLDEAQDVNALQIELVSRMVHANGRLIAVGDRKQAIYGFRGALADCMDEIQDRFAAVPLPLSICYRCPKKIVAHAKTWVPQIEPRKGAEEGVLTFGSADSEDESEKMFDASRFEKTDVVLCRLNRPLVSLAFRLIRGRVGCKIAGRDIGKGLVEVVKSIKAENLEALEEGLEKWRASQIRRAKGDAGKISTANDRADTLLVFIDNQRSQGGTQGTLIEEIGKMFVDAEPGKPQSILLLSTVHKAKGGEWERVFVLDASEFMPMPWAKGEWQEQQERNLMYVAATRAKRELHYISSERVRI